MSYRITIAGVIRQAVNKVQIFGRTKLYLQALLKPADTLNQSFVDEVERVKERQQYTSQQASLETRLNNLFDSTFKRIYIETIPPLFVEFFYKKENTNKTYTYSKSNPNTQLYAWQKTTFDGMAALGINFVVYVPAAIYNANKVLIEEEVRYYALAGKNWLVRRDDEVIIIPELETGLTLTA